MTEKRKCIFCDIVAGNDLENTDIIVSDDKLVVFRDIRPASPHHYLVVTKEHIKDAKTLTQDHLPLVRQMMELGQQVLQKQGADTTDVRMGFHWPPFHAISHLHLHVISSTNQMGWIASGIYRPNSFWFVTVDWLVDRLEKMAKTNKDSEATES